MNFDLQVNKLISQLKKNDWLKESQILSQKYLQLKQAEVHLYRVFDENGEDFLNYAHQYGSPSLGLGNDDKIEILTDAHQDILDVLLKQPTHKLASLIQSTGEILGIKQAQEAPKEPVTTVDPTSQKQKIDNLNQYLATNWPDLIQKVNNLFSIFNLVGYKGLSIFSFLAEDLLIRGGQNQALATDYGRRSGTGNALSQYINLHQKVYGSLNINYFNSDTLVARIASFSNDETGYAGLKNFGNLLGSEITSKFFVGSTASAVKSTTITWRSDHEVWRDNAVSIWSPSWNPLAPWQKDDANVKAAADAMHNLMVQKFNAILGPDLINSANASLGADLAKIKEAISQALQILGTEAPVYTIQSRSTFDTIDKLAAANAFMTQLSAEGNLGKLLTSIVTTLGISAELLTPATFFQRIDQVKIKLTELVNYLNNLSLSPLDFTYSPKEAQEAANLYASTLEILQRKLEMTTEGSDLYQRTAADMAQAQKLMEIVASGAGNKFYKVFDQLKKNFKWMPKDAAEITTAAQSWAQAVLSANSVKAFLEPESFIKVAQAPMPSSVGPKPTTIPAKSTTVPAGGTKKAPTKSTVPAHLSNISDDEKEAVKLMQDVLHSLGVLLEESGQYSRVDTIKLKNSGETRNIAYGDGFWGPRTSASLETANRLFKLNLIITRNESTVVPDAEENTKSLEYILTQVQSKRKPGTKTSIPQGEVVDRLPQKIEWHREPELASFDGKISITLRQLSSLESLYNFLKTSGIQSPSRVGATETSLGEEGFTFLEFGWIVNWFKRRSVFLFNTFREKPEFASFQNRAKAYYDSIVGLEQELTQIYREQIAHLPEAQKAQFLITPDILQESLPAVEKEYQGKRKLTRETPEDLRIGYRGRPGETMQAGLRRGGPGEFEGKTVKRPAPKDDSPPIGENVDLRREWFANIAYDHLTSPVLNLNQLLRIPAVTLAQTLMLPSDQFNPEAQYYVMVRSGIPENYIRWNQQRQEYETYMVDQRNLGQWYGMNYLQSQPWFSQRFPALAAKAKNPVDQFQTFLLQLRQELNKSVNDWVSSTEPTEDEALAVSEYLARWQKAINNKLRQLADWRRS